MKSSETITALAGYPKTWLAPLGRALSESKGVQILSGLLVLQLALAGGLLWKSASQVDFSSAVQLVSIEPATIDELVIDDGEGRITLKNTDDQWRMDDEHKTLADAAKVNQLLTEISELKPGLPVASTTGSHQQLEVSDSGFQRRVTLKVKDEVAADFYMGTSPGFRKSHVRPVDQDQVYAARLNTFDVPVEQNDWLDKNLLAFDKVKGVQTDAVELAVADEKWTIVSPQDQVESHSVDPTGIASLAGRLETLRVNGFATPLVADEPSDAAPADEDSEQPEPEELLTHSIAVVQSDTPVTLVLSRKGSDATIERSDVEGLYALPISTYEALTAEAIQQLIVDKSSVAPAAEDVATPQG